MAPNDCQKKLVVILGATGLQGGYVARTLFAASHRYTIRGLSRNISSPKAQALLEMGIEMRQADLNDPKSLQAGFEGAHIIYAMTDFWQTMSATEEEVQGKSIMDIAANLPELEQLIWAGLPDARAISGGRFTNVYHWQSKAAVSEYIRIEKPALCKKTTIVLFPNYFENCLTNPGTYLPVKDNKQADGTYLRSFVLPDDTDLPNVAISDTGRLVQYILDYPDLCLEKTIAFYSQSISEGKKIQSLASAYNINIRYESMSPEEFQTSLKKHKMDDVTALDFTEQLLIFCDFGNIYERSEFVQANQLPGLKLTTWDEFLAANNLLSHVTSK